MNNIATFPILNPDIKNPHITDSIGVPLELYNMILEPKRKQLAELLEQVRYLQNELTQLEETLKDRVDGTTIYYDTYMIIHE